MLNDIKDNSYRQHTHNIVRQVLSFAAVAQRRGHGLSHDGPRFDPPERIHANSASCETWVAIDSFARKPTTAEGIEVMTLHQP